MPKQSYFLLLPLLMIGCASGWALEDLSATAEWEYRLVGPGQDQAWIRDLNVVQARVQNLSPKVEWPKVWTTFTPWSATTSVFLDETGEPEQISTLPTAMTIAGQAGCRAGLPVYIQGVLDFTIGHGAPRLGIWAYAFAKLPSPLDQEVRVVFQSSGATTWWCDTKKVFSATKAGIYSFPLNLSKGEHLLAVKVASGENAWNLSGSLEQLGPDIQVQTRCNIPAPRSSTIVCLSVLGPHCQRTTINGHSLSGPIRGMVSEKIEGISPNVLQQNPNVVEQSLTLEQFRWSASNAQILALWPEDIDLEWGPITTQATSTTAIVVCRLTGTLAATLRINHREYTSFPGTLHQWILDNLQPGTKNSFTLSFGEKSVVGEVRTLPVSGPVTLCLLGDPQSGKPWKQISQAVSTTAPDALVILGDLVGDGLQEKLWKTTFFDASWRTLAKTPCLAVLGNHDRYSPLFDWVFSVSPDQRNWTRDLGAALLIGLDGGLDWSPEGTNARWLHQTLQTSKHPFVFVVSHYPAYSSRNHGKLTDDGIQVERTSRVARTQILPILEQYHVTATFSGHDHGYERTEVPSGLSAIVAAGGGAGLYGKRDDPRQNPLSSVFVQKHHFCTLRIDNKQAVLTVQTAEGETIDTRTWSATNGRIR